MDTGPAKCSVELRIQEQVVRDPIPMLKEWGIEYPECVTVGVVEGEEGVRGIKVFLVRGRENGIELEAPAGSYELTNEDLEGISAAGMCYIDSNYKRPSYSCGLL